MGPSTARIVAAAWLGFPVAYVFAMCCDWFIASPPAKGFAFKFLVTPGKSSPLRYDARRQLLHGRPHGHHHVALRRLRGPVPYARRPACQFAGAADDVARQHSAQLYHGPAWNLLVAGPVARFVFRRAFPMGTVFAEPHMELVHMPGAPAAEEVPTFPRAWSSSLPARQRSEPDPQTDRSDSFFVDVVVWLRAEKVPTVNIYSIWVKRPKRCRGAALCV